MQLFDIKLERRSHGGPKVVEEYALASVDGQELEGSAWKQPRHSLTFKLASDVGNGAKSLADSSG
jgi:hypothetical protein